MLYIFYFADLQQIFKINKIIYNALSNNGLDFLRETVCCFLQLRPNCRHGIIKTKSVPVGLRTLLFAICH